MAKGLADELRQVPDLAVFGPTHRAARLEADKAWTKQILRRAGVPTPRGRALTDPDLAEDYARDFTTPPVVKPVGLDTGKDAVVVPQTQTEALAAIDRLMRQRAFGDAGAHVLIEERLEGAEASVQALVDGRTIRVLAPFQGSKRLLAGDRGPNTGGLVAWSPAPLALDAAQIEGLEHQVFAPTVKQLAAEGIEYRGVLYAGLLLTRDGPAVLEFNVRWSDPDLLMARLQSDLAELLWRTATGTLHAAPVIE